MNPASAPLDAAVFERVRASLARQGAMATLGAELANVAAGRVALALPIEPRLSQQDGFLHAGVVVAALDSACGYAALTLMPDDAEVLTVELKVNLLAPAGGDSLVAEGEVVRAGRTLTVCSGDAQREWHVIVAASERLPLLHALRARCGRQALPGAAPERETLELLAQAFSGRTGLYEEIKAFLSEAGIPCRTTVW